MELILREDVPSLGQIGDVVKVKPGYARNYLLPRGLAVVADKRNIKRLEHEQRVVGERRERVLRAAQSAAEKIAAVRLTIKARAGEEGKLFGSVTSMDLERELNSRGVALDRKRIRLDEPIKHLGEHKVSVHLGVGVDAEFTVIVEPLELPKPGSETAPAPEGATVEPSKEHD
jgi:large subunit ribosomal protein L9